MSENVTVLLAKAGWCHYCIEFTPIYEEALKMFLTHNFFKDEKIMLEKSYDMAEEQVKNLFQIKHSNAMDKIEGYPTVLLKIKENYYQVDTTQIDKSVKPESQISEASKRFLENIINVFKTVNSDSKNIFVNISGGSKHQNKILSSDNNYKKKYLKYKHKYLSLKNKN